MKEMGSPPHRRINHEGHKDHEEVESSVAVSKAVRVYLQGLHVLHGEEPLRLADRKTR